MWFAISTTRKSKYFTHESFLYKKVGSCLLYGIFMWDSNILLNAKLSTRIILSDGQIAIELALVYFWDLAIYLLFSKLLVADAVALHDLL